MKVTFKVNKLKSNKIINFKQKKCVKILIIDIVHDIYKKKKHTNITKTTIADVYYITNTATITDIYYKT